MIEDTFQRAASDIQEDQFDLLVERQRKYGNKNIEQGGILGCLIRAGDKLERLKQVFPTVGITKRYNKDYPDESIEDAMLDLANYATIALMLYRDTWGKPLAENYNMPKTVAPPYENDYSEGTQDWQIDQYDEEPAHAASGYRGGTEQIDQLTDDDYDLDDSFDQPFPLRGTVREITTALENLVDCDGRET